jgi:hypothetical protein
LEVQIRTTFLAPDRERQRNINFAIEVIWIWIFMGSRGKRSAVG